MDGFGDVLWRHLDEEVEVLGAGSMNFGGGGDRGVADLIYIHVVWC